MMKRLDHRQGILTASSIMLAILVMVTPVLADNAEIKAQSVERLALLPLINLSNNRTAPEIILPVIYEQLSHRQINVISPDRLRDILRKNRIRSTGMIDRAGAENLKRELGLTNLLIGSIDYYNDRFRPEVGLSLRLMSLDDYRIIEAVSLSATGSDFIGMFGAGQIDSIGSLTEIVVERLLDRLFQSQSDLNRNRSDGPPTRVLIVPFENSSKNRFAGLIVGNQLIAALTGQGFEVIEPGLANDIFLSNRQQPVGGIGLPLLKKLREQELPQIIITGMVDEFRPARGASSQAEPTLELSARLLKASDGQILYMYNDERKGSDSESFFRHGKCNALGELVNKSLTTLVKQIKKKENSFGPYIEK